MWPASIVPFLFGFSSSGLILDVSIIFDLWSLILILYESGVVWSDVVWCGQHLSLGLFESPAAAALASLSISCTVGEQESHVMSCQR